MSFPKAFFVLFGGIGIARNKNAGVKCGRSYKCKQWKFAKIIVTRYQSRLSQHAAQPVGEDIVV